MKKSIICITAFGDYRAGVLKILSKNKNFSIYGGTEAFDNTVKTIKSTSGFFSEIKNNFLLNRKFLFQSNCIFDCIKSENLVIDLNPRIINVWVLLFTRRLLGKKTVLWGHAWSRAGKNEGTFHPRLILKKLSSGIIVYTNTQKKELLDSGYTKPIWVAPNALYNKEYIVKSKSKENPTNILYVGRLVKEKKPDLLIKSYALLSEEKRSAHKLIVIGEGPESDNLKSIARSLKIEDDVIFMGHISDESKLSEIYSKSIASVSPGYVGLSITQSFAFGTPMIISEKENHSPEIEAANKENSVLFESNNIKDLSKKIEFVINNKKYWLEKEKEIKKFCSEQYSCEAMAKGIENGLFWKI